MATRLATSDADILACFPVYRQLRPHLVEDQFVASVHRMHSTGFQLAMRTHEERVMAVGGFRIYENFHSGRLMYVDDLVTDEAARSAGHGQALLRWLIEYAKDHRCLAFELDSGTQRHGAHKFYLREGMHISDFHFSLPLKSQKPVPRSEGDEGG
jgi:GNAT superfamily N-acetyltransferase